VARLLRREKGVEDARLGCRVHPSAVVGDLDLTTVELERCMRASIDAVSATLGFGVEKNQAKVLLDYIATNYARSVGQIAAASGSCGLSPVIS